MRHTHARRIPAALARNQHQRKKSGGLARARAHLFFFVDTPGTQKDRVYPRDPAASMRGYPPTRSQWKPAPSAGGRSSARPTQ